MAMTMITRALTLTAVTLAALALAGCTSGPSPEPSNTGPNVTSLTTGDCVDDADLSSGLVSTVPVVSCTEPHDSEVYSRGVIDVTGDYPGDEQVRKAAEQLCGPAFVTFIGLTYDKSAYDYGYLVPTAATWADDDRTIICLARADDQKKLIGTLQGVDK